MGKHIYEDGMPPNILFDQQDAIRLRYLQLVNTIETKTKNPALSDSGIYTFSLSRHL